MVYSRMMLADALLVYWKKDVMSPFLSPKFLTTPLLISLHFAISFRWQDIGPQYAGVLLGEAWIHTLKKTYQDRGYIDVHDDDVMHNNICDSYDHEIKYGHQKIQRGVLHRPPFRHL